MRFYLSTLALFTLFIYGCRETSSITGWENGEVDKNDSQVSQNNTSNTTENQTIKAEEIVITKEVSKVEKVTKEAESTETESMTIETVQEVPQALDGGGLAPNIQTKRAKSYVKSSPNPFAGGIAGNNGNGSGNSSGSKGSPSYQSHFAKLQSMQDAGEAGKITAGDLNDLSEWEFWKDIATEQLSIFQDWWKINPKNRVVFSVQNNDGIPLIGATIELYSNQSNDPIWISRTDNSGFAQMFERVDLDDSTTTICHAVIRFNGKEERVNKPKMLSRGVNIVRFRANCEPSNEVDIAFVVDATGSMQDEIDFLKKDLLDIIEGASASNSEVDLSLASLFYRCEGNDYVTKQSDFSSDLNQTMNFIKEQNADQGGDEVVATALDEAINNLSWRDGARTKLLFIVLDEPQKASPEVIAATKKAFKDASEKGIKIIPCVASGTSSNIDKRLEYIMRSGAMLTNGTYVFFTNDSGIGGNHTLPIVKSFEVEKLNVLLKRIISSNIEVATCEDPDNLENAITETGNNHIDEMKKLMDSIMALGNDSLKIAELLPYTDYDSYESFNENRPVDSLDTARFLVDHNMDIIHWKAFPNPTFGEVTIETSRPVDAIHVLDLHGRILQQYEPGSRVSSNFDLINYPRGTYLIVMIAGKQKLTARIVKV